MFQSANVEDSTSILVYDYYDEKGSSVLTPNYDMDSTPHHVYDMYDDVGMIIPEYDKGWEICVEDNNDGDDLVDERRSKNLYKEGSPH